MEIEIPCNKCCKHVRVDLSTFQDGGVVRCRHCGNNIKFRPKKNNKPTNNKR